MTAPTPVKASGYTHEGASGWWASTEFERTPALHWPESVATYSNMRRQDAQITSVLRAVTLPVRRTPWRVDPNGARPEVAELVAEDLGLPLVGNPVPAPLRGRTRGRFSWLEHLRLALLMLVYGHSVFEQEYRIDGQGRARLAKLELRPAHTIAEFKVARDGGLVSVRQWGMAGSPDPDPMPVDRLVVYVLDREGGNWVGNSLLRPAYKNWLLKDRLLRVQTQTIERNGMGVPVYTAAEGEASTDAGLAIATDVRSGETAGAALPHGAELELMGVQGHLPDATPVIRYHDEQIARAVLAHFLNLGTQTGSWALGTTFADFFTLSLQALAKDIADVATAHVVEDIVDANWGEEEPAPRIVFDEIGSQQAITAQAIKMLVDARAIMPDAPLEQALRQRYGLPPGDPDRPEPEPVQDMPGAPDG